MKGAAFRELLRWYRNEYGTDALQDALNRLEPQDRDSFDPSDEFLGVFTTRWYDARLVHHLIDALVEPIVVDQRSAMAHAAAHAVMNRTLRGIYRVLFDWMATPARYAKYADKLWQSYYDSGEFVVRMPDEQSAICTIRDWEAHHRFICDLNRGAAAAIYEAMGCEDVVVTRQACIEDGDAECRFRTTWS